MSPEAIAAVAAAVVLVIRELQLQRDRRLRLTGQRRSREGDPPRRDQRNGNGDR